LFHSIAASENFVFTGTNVTDKAIGQDINYLIAIDIATGKEAWTFRLFAFSCG
jgi:outer membrane protein assembly factor BamB